METSHLPMSKSSTKSEQYDLLLDSPNPCASGKMSPESSAPQTMRSAASSAQLWALLNLSPLQNGQARVLPLDQNDGLPGAHSMPNISIWPNDGSVCSLSDVLETGPIPAKYYLSAKACAGIIRRAARRGKALPPQLEAALRAVAHRHSPHEPKAVGGLGTDFDCDGGLVTQPVAATLRSGSTNAASHNKASGLEENLIAHTLRAEHNASEDGTGRGTPLVAELCPTLRAGGNVTGGDRPPGTDVDTCESLVAELPPVAWALQERDSSTKDGHLIPVAFRACGQDGFDPSPITPPLCNSDGGGTVPSVAYRTSDNCGVTEQGDRTAALNCATDPNQQIVTEPMAFESRFARNGMGAPDTVVPPLKAQSGQTGKGDAAPLVQCAMAVRRLLPEEAEKLQGFKVGYTRITYRGKPAADGPRYKSLGNSFAVPVVAWLGKRILQITSPKPPPEPPPAS